MAGRNPGVTTTAAANATGAAPAAIGGSEPPASKSPAAVLAAALRDDPRLGSELVHALRLPATPESTAPLDPPLPPRLAAALAAAGLGRSWSHQAEALAAARAGEDVLVTTPTASGKSLVFQLPVLEEALRGGPGRALLLFPLKALGQDQKTKLDRLAAAAGLTDPAAADDAVGFCEIYDGDTPAGRRTVLRNAPPRVLITNPDMLHLGLLAHWPSWGPFLADLRWVVLDELHTYRGIFGSHFHHVLRRLLRLAARLGATPSLIASSATAGNAGEFAAALAGRSFRWVEESGAPREARHLLLFRPAASPYTTALELFDRCLAAGLKTIVFTKARRITELLYSWLRQRDPQLARRVACYRSGFLPEERRRIEAELFAGRLDGVISTSALEMGIDVGGLDACILVGYPGSVMATWQRSGRVGRRVGGEARESLTALVALPDALDQWFLDHPEQLVGRPCERLVVDPANRPISRAHLVCAAAEAPLSRAADAAYLAPHGELLGELLAASELLEAEGGDELFSLARRPHRQVPLRGGGATYRIVRAAGGRTVGTVDGVRVLHECHPGAVYLHGGRQYLVSELDRDRRQVVAERVRLDYYTQPLTDKETEILEVLAERHRAAAGGPPLDAWLGRVRVTERVVGFERRRVGDRNGAGRELLDRQTLDLPPVSYETIALWWAAPRALEETLRRHGRDPMGSLHASEHATIALLPLLALCDRNDVGGISYPRHPQVGSGAVFVYDGHAGGVGIAAAGFAALEELLGRVAEAVSGCSCESGCPSCVQSPKCGNGNRPLDKAGAVEALELLLGRTDPAVPWGPPVELRLERTPGWARGGAGEGGGAAQASREPIGEGRGSDAAAGSAVEPSGPDERTATGSADGQRPDGEPAATAAPARRGGRAPRRGPRGSTATAHASATARPQVVAASSLAASSVAASSVAGSSFAASIRDILGILRCRLPSWLRRRRPPRSPAGWPAGGTVLFDLETLRSAAEVGGWGNAHRMGVAIGVACHLEAGRLAAFGEGAVGELVAALAAADLVVGFNVKRFDYRVLAGYTGVDYARRLRTLDLLEEIHRRLGFRIGLGHLAQETLGVGKSADGLQSLAWVRQGRLDLVEDYCRRDVAVLRDLYLHGRREGFVVYRDRQRDARLRVRVDW